MTSIDILILVCLITFVILTFILSGIIFLLLSQRRFKIKNIDTDVEKFLNLILQESTKSDEIVLKSLDAFNFKLKENSSLHIKTGQSLDKFVTHILNELKNMSEHIDSIQKLALEKENKIRRYEDGYDKKIINQFINSLIRILGFISHARKKDDSNSLKEIEEDILLLLENNGIYKTKINEYDFYEEHIKFAKIVGTYVVDSEEMDSKIKEVVKNGYYIEPDNVRIAIQDAEVIVNKYQRNSDV